MSRVVVGFMLPYAFVVGMLAGWATSEWVWAEKRQAIVHEAESMRAEVQRLWILIERGQR